MSTSCGCMSGYVLTGAVMSVLTLLVLYARSTAKAAKGLWEAHYPSLQASSPFRQFPAVLPFSLALERGFDRKSGV